ncbi:hypothetical protein BO86DRAFT_146412 [Aspergillus japonicus CBS 114.51]|uniref:Uncharacterized protein n=1 Tax=Aspergillus japonicus CBS 114.51 TaxID=1448312 RepID=A0A8T8WWS6_ASPJA|nr:hypothetical protein BO86DRAFT_146412 [Aspergillus japonicus CBS 114.51]RAH79749.1 hypothetical protein BO86DRAFT_146412 [Aspergillus japonicus CBS 114.51]
MLLRQWTYSSRLDPGTPNCPVGQCVDPGCRRKLESCIRTRKGTALSRAWLRGCRLRSLPPRLYGLSYGGWWVAIGRLLDSLTLVVDGGLTGDDGG